MSKLRLVVYDPPIPGFPYLAAALMPDGTVVAESFDRMREAQGYLLALAESEDPSSEKPIDY